MMEACHVAGNGGNGCKCPMPSLKNCVLGFDGNFMGHVGDPCWAGDSVGYGYDLEELEHSGARVAVENSVRSCGKERGLTIP